MKKKHLTALDLFSGAGGFSEGLAQAGIRSLVAQELHPQPALTHVFNHPGTVGVVGDIRSLDPKVIVDLLQKHHGVKTVDLIVGGPPCQGFSTAGKKNKDDPRNTLFDDYCDLVAAIRPKALVLENVPGFKKMYSGQMYEAAKERLSELGYTLSDRILNALDFGVPQRRRRFVMVGVRSDLKLNFDWPQATHENPELPGNDLFSSGLERFVSVEDALSDLAFLEPGMEAHRHLLEATSAYQIERRGSGMLFNHLASKHRDKAVETFRQIREGSTINSVPEGLKSAKVTMARLDRKHISNTVLALPDDLIHYQHDRIPTVREMARLQSFDDDYVFIGKRTSGFIDRKHDVPQYTQVGNAVPPYLARAIGRSLARMFGVSPVDIRDPVVRRDRLNWIHGTSGYSGYSLSELAEGEINLYDIHGSPLTLPINESPTAVKSRPHLEDWKATNSKGVKGQWAPGVPRPDVALHAENKRRTQTAPVKETLKNLPMTGA
jgi:DNA (cytosine-5)-methyltransferase 1